MSDTLGLGKIIESEQHRDAIHVAVAPVVADCKLVAGKHIGLLQNGNASDDADKLIGIVDPFLKTSVKKGQRFWMFLYPYTITSLRHEWTHPAFESSGNSSAEQWLRDFSEEIGLSYAAMMQAINKVHHGGDCHIFSNDTPDECYSKMDDMWRNWEIVTGNKQADHSKTVFSCSC